MLGKFRYFGSSAKLWNPDETPRLRTLPTWAGLRIGSALVGFFLLLINSFKEKIAVEREGRKLVASETCGTEPKCGPRVPAERGMWKTRSAFGAPLTRCGARSGSEFLEFFGSPFARLRASVARHRRNGFSTGVGTRLFRAGSVSDDCLSSLALPARKFVVADASGSEDHSSSACNSRTVTAIFASSRIVSSIFRRACITVV